MKKILIAVLVLLSCVPAFAGYATPVQTNKYGSVSGTGALLTCSTVSLSTGENVIVHVGWHAGVGGTVTILSLVDSGGTNTYTQVGITYVDANSDGWALFYAKNVTALSSGTLTATLSGSSSGANILVIERWTGLDPTASPSTAYQNTQLTPGTATDAITTGAMTPPVANAMAWGIGYDLNHGTGHMFSGTGYTSLGLINGVPGADVITEYQVISSTTPLAATFTTDINDGRSAAGAVFPLAVIGSSIVPIVVSEMLH